MTVRGAADYIDHFRARVVQDAMAEATAAYWHRRADAFAAVGNERCDATAHACRCKAAVIERYGVEDEVGVLIASELGQVA